MASDHARLGTASGESSNFALPRLEAELAGLWKTFFLTPLPDLEPVAALLERLGGIGDARLLGSSRCLQSWGYFVHGNYELMLASANEAIGAFESLSVADRQTCLEPHVDALRARGTALIWMNRLTDSLPQLATAVQVAQTGIAASPADTPEPRTTRCLRAYFRALIDFGAALFAMEDYDTAIDVYIQALTISPPANDEVWTTYDNDRMIARINCIEALHERAHRWQITHPGTVADDDLGMAHALLNLEAWRLEEKLDRQQPYRERYMQPMYFGAWGKHFLLTGELGQARMMFERQAAACTPAPVDNEARTQAQIGLAHVALDENCPRDAVSYGTRALESLDPLTAPTARAKVLVVIASAQRALGNYEAAYAAIEESNQLRLRARPMAGAWNSAYKTLTKTVDDLKVIQAQLLAQTQTYEFLSTTDDLTQLPNRRKFDSQFTVESARAQRNDQELVIVIFDIDHFKRVNDTYGHPAGDAVLQSVAKIVQSELRPGDLLARVGGEEFALLLPQTALAQGALIAERIRKALAGASISRDGRTIHVTASFGVAQVTASNAPFADTLERADAALYRAKHSGRNQVCCEQ